MIYQSATPYNAKEFSSKYLQNPFNNLFQIAMQIIKFRSEYRIKLSNKMVKVVSELSSEDNPLKIRVRKIY